MNQPSTMPEYLVEDPPLERMHLSTAQSRDITSKSLVLIAQKLERLLLLDSMSHALLKDIQEESDKVLLSEQEP